MQIYGIYTAYSVGKKNKIMCIIIYKLHKHVT